MLADLIHQLRCVHCRGQLTWVGPSLSCARGHTFDVARHGYVSMLPGDARRDAGDTAAMVRAREAVLAAGHYEPIARLVADCAEQGGADRGCVVDAGAGTGYYLARTLDLLDGRHGIALDISKYASRRAARAHPRIGAVACDVWRGLPVADRAASVVLDVFAPRNGPEFRRVLQPDGVLVVVTPTRRHLTELVGALGLLTVDARKDERVVAALGEHFTETGLQWCEQTIELGHDDVAAVTAMGPSAWHADPETLRRDIAGLPERMPVTVSVQVATYRPR